MSKHHLFTYEEVKQKLIETYDILGKDKGDIDQKAADLWNIGSVIELSIRDHNTYHRHFDGVRSEEDRKIDEFYAQKHEEIAVQLGTNPLYVRDVRVAIMGCGEEWYSFGKKMLDRIFVELFVASHQFWR